MREMSFGRRNTDWQAWGQHRRRVTARMAQKNREREIEEAHEKHLIDQERRAKIALQRAINRINVGKRL